LGPPRVDGDSSAGMTRDLEHARALLQGAQRIVVLTGAGVSAESGVPTFRGPGGLWKSRRPEELATPEAFLRDPRTVWEWYAWRRGIVAACRPNGAHLALAALALRHPSTVIVTQNVDGLHHRAADAVVVDEMAAHENPGRHPAPCDASRAHPLEIHGALHRDRCSRCARRSPPLARVDTTSVETLPRCTACRGLLRPDVVWFGESLDADVLERSFEAARWADLCLVVGTSSVVYPAAAVPQLAHAHGAVVIEVNPEATPLSEDATVCLRGAAGEIVPSLVAGPHGGR
jgi:NAD-dependent deacetylase